MGNENSSASRAQILSCSTWSEAPSLGHSHDQDLFWSFLSPLVSLQQGAGASPVLSTVGSENVLIASLQMQLREIRMGLASAHTTTAFGQGLPTALPCPHTVRPFWTMHLGHPVVPLGCWYSLPFLVLCLLGYKDSECHLQF
jgi:hypothetical protein